MSLGRIAIGFVLVLASRDCHAAPGAASLIPDPRSDGWQSEATADAAQLELKKFIGTILADASPKATGKGPWELRPATERTHQSASLSVRRKAVASPTPSSLAEAVKAFRKGLALDATFKIKTTAVQEKPTLQTTHLIHIASKGMEWNGTWVCQWQQQEEALALVGIACPHWEETTTTSAGPWFVDQTADILNGNAELTKQFSHGGPHWQWHVPAWLGFFKFGHHGLAIADVNGDGLEDIHICQPAGLPNRLLLHQPDHTVKDAAAAWGVDFLDNTQTSLLADFDNDGDPDLVLATYGPLVFFENTGTKFEIRLRLPPVSNVYALAAADFDLDGDLDLFAGRYFANPEDGGSLAVPVPQFHATNGGRNFLIRNTGRVTAGWMGFADATTESGMDENNNRFTYAAVWEDVNRDGLPDLYVANDYGRNNLYLQEKSGGGAARFRDVTAAAGLDSGAFGMSAATGDVNRDGWPDLHLGAMFSSAGSRITSQQQFRSGAAVGVREEFQRMAAGNSLFLNKATTPLGFTDASAAAGIRVGRWSWASLFADFNNDGWQDLLVANGFMSGGVPDDL